MKAPKPGQIVEFTVTGKGRFPVDMLRHDRCWPATEQVSSQFNNSWAAGEHTLQLNGIKPPTAERWASFGWTVADYRIRP